MHDSEIVEAALAIVTRQIDRETISSSSMLDTYLALHMGLEPLEQFRALFLDGKNRLIADEVMGRGTVNHAPVYPREVARTALRHHAQSVIVAHNHPSGDPTPSQGDIEMTKKLRKALNAIDITLIDHVVVGRSNYSFKMNGLI
jgi:DNA repair protein RadC